jgi:hypothetical protein
MQSGGRAWVEKKMNEDFEERRDPDQEINTANQRFA